MIDDITPYWLGTARALREPGQPKSMRAPEATRSIIYPTSARPFFFLSLSLPLSQGLVNYFSFLLKCLRMFVIFKQQRSEAEEHFDLNLVCLLTRRANF